MAACLLHADVHVLLPAPLFGNTRKFQSERLIVGAAGNDVNDLMEHDRLNIVFVSREMDTSVLDVA